MDHVALKTCCPNGFNNTWQYSVELIHKHYPKFSLGLTFISDLFLKPYSQISKTPQMITSVHETVRWIGFNSIPWNFPVWGVIMLCIITYLPTDPLRLEWNWILFMHVFLFKWIHSKLIHLQRFKESNNTFQFWQHYQLYICYRNYLYGTILIQWWILNLFTTVCQGSCMLYINMAAPCTVLLWTFL